MQSTQVFEEGVAGVPAKGLCGGTWRARVRFGSAAGWGAWTLLAASNAATTDPCPV